MARFDGKSVIVTGAASGIGSAVVSLLAGAGANVTIADVDESAGQNLVAQIESLGGSAQFVRTDVSLEADAAHLVTAATDRFGRLHGACNAAGVPQSGKLPHEITLEEWDHCHAINLRGLFLCNKYEMLAMLPHGGSIVNIASTSSIVGFQNASEYCASKAGVLGFTRGAAVDYAAKGIRVNAVLPGATRTPMLEAAMEQDPTLERALAAVHPMNRFAQPAEIAAAACFLLSDDASFVTGAAYTVDGGHTAI